MQIQESVIFLLSSFLLWTFLRSSLISLLNVIFNGNILHLLFYNRSILKSVYIESFFTFSIFITFLLFELFIIIKIRIHINKIFLKFHIFHEFGILIDQTIV